jgi:hypothetical protein
MVLLKSSSFFKGVSSTKTARKHLEIVLTKYITDTVTKSGRIYDFRRSLQKKDPITSKRHPPLT